MIYFSIFISIFCIIQGVVGSLLVSSKKIKSSMASDILIIGSISIGIIGLIVIGAVK